MKKDGVLGTILDSHEEINGAKMDTLFYFSHVFETQIFDAQSINKHIWTIKIMKKSFL